MPHPRAEYKKYFVFNYGAATDVSINASVDVKTQETGYNKSVVATYWKVCYSTFIFSAQNFIWSKRKS